MSQKTILLAEDDALLRHALLEKLTREGFLVHTAHNGEECLEMALRLHPDLLLLDVLMPRMDGIAVLKELRDDPWGETVKVVLLTNVTDAQRLMEGGPYRSDGYLIKSDTNIGDVIAEIREHLDISRLVGRSLDAGTQLPEYRCACGKLLFKGALLFSTIEIKCKRCGEVRLIDTAGQASLG